MMIDSLAILALAENVSLQETGRTGVSGWVWAVLIIIVVILIAWWGLRSSQKEPTRGAQPPAAHIESTPVQTFPAGESMAAPAPVPDDLTIIEGIGPKIASLLQAAGITTFQQLGSTEVGQIEEILHTSGLRLADPGSWPEQARLAAAGDQAGLKDLQDRLKGGRQV